MRGITTMSTFRMAPQRPRRQLGTHPKPHHMQKLPGQPQPLHRPPPMGKPHLG
jgi:hypothetical protein